jgi:hypothetical protein
MRGARMIDPSDNPDLLWLDGGALGCSSREYSPMIRWRTSEPPRYVECGTFPMTCVSIFSLSSWFPTGTSSSAEMLDTASLPDPCRTGESRCSGRGRRAQMREAVRTGSYFGNASPRSRPQVVANGVPLGGSPASAGRGC